VQLTDEGRAAHTAAGLLFLPVLDEVTRRLAGAADETHQRLIALHTVLAATARARTTRTEPPPGRPSTTA